MSSHHFVREGQEPSLYIHDAIPFAQVAPLLEWAPVVITRSAVVEDVLAWGIKIDVVIDETDAVKRPSDFVAGMPVRIFPSNKNGILQTLMTVLDTDGQQSISIVVADAEKFLQHVGSSWEDYQVSVLDDRWRWVAVKSRFAKWLPENSLLRLYPSNHYTAQGGILSSGTLAVSKDGLVEVCYDGIFWVGETY